MKDWQVELEQEFAIQRLQIGAAMAKTISNEEMRAELEEELEAKGREIYGNPPGKIVPPVQPSPLRRGLELIGGLLGIGLVVLILVGVVWFVFANAHF